MDPERIPRADTTGRKRWEKGGKESHGPWLVTGYVENPSAALPKPKATGKCGSQPVSQSTTSPAFHHLLHPCPASHRCYYPTIFSIDLSLGLSHVRAALRSHQGRLRRSCCLGCSPPVASHRAITQSCASKRLRPIVGQHQGLQLCHRSAACTQLVVKFLAREQNATAPRAISMKWRSAENQPLPVWHS